MNDDEEILDLKRRAHEVAEEAWKNLTPFAKVVSNNRTPEKFAKLPYDIQKAVLSTISAELCVRAGDEALKRYISKQ